MHKIFLKLGMLVAVLMLTGAGCFSLSNKETVTTTGPAGVFVSLDRGDNWKQISLMPEAEAIKSLADVSVYRLVMDPSDAKGLYWASREKGLFYSYDSGETWNQAQDPLNKGFVYSAAVDPKDKCNIFATDGFRIYWSQDCMRSWKEVYREDNVNARISQLMFNPHGNKQIYASKISGDLIRSNDLGTTWTVVNRFGKIRIESFAFDPVKDGVIYAASKDKGLYVTADGGASWTNTAPAMKKQFTKSLEYRRLFTHPTKADTVYWISTYGILESTNQGKTWQALKLISSPGSVDIYGFGVNPKNDQEIYYTTTIAGRSTLYRTEDGGTTWSTKKLPTGQIPTNLIINPDTPETIYVGFSIPPKA